MIKIDTPTNIKEYSIDFMQARNKLSPYYPHSDIPILHTSHQCIIV